MRNDIYLHGIGNHHSTYYVPKIQDQLLMEILDSGKLKTKKELGIDVAGFNGDEYISLCDYEKRDIYNNQQYYNAFYGYVLNSIAFGFPKGQFEVIEPEVIERLYGDGVRAGQYMKHFEIMRELGLSEEGRYTDMPDEVQHKGSLNLDYIDRVTFPTETYLAYLMFRKPHKKIAKLEKEIRLLRDVIKSAGYNVPLVDIDSMEELTEESAYNIGTRILTKK